jgi:hypothetical protein
MWSRRVGVISALVMLVVPALGQEPAAATDEPRSNLTLPPGTWVSVRVDQELSSDHSYPGDAFTATLAQPLIADGLVVARRGQMAGGHVVEAVKAGKAKGTSRLAIELSEITLVDGRQVPVKTRLIQSEAGTSVGRDAGAVAATTGVGAAIGGVADGGFGAGMGAIAGAAAGIIGVLTTRGRATVVYPETQVTFRLEDPLTISTESAARAFRAATAEDYEQKTLRREGRAPTRPRYYYGGWDPWYGPYYPRYFYGPSLHFYSGPRPFGRWGFGRRW